MTRVMEEALDAVTFYRERVAAISALAPSAEAVLQCFRDRPEQRLSAALIREATGLPGRTVTRALTTLLKSSLVQRIGRGPATRYQLVF
jgi:DNA-binding IclR family transcriptional regulator